jgi:disulfide bond formation protein DsbB
MAGIEFKKNKPLQIFLLKLLILGLIIGIYFMLKEDEKIINNPKALPVCLLGSYILINSILSFAHSWAYKKYKKQ